MSKTARSLPLIVLCSLIQVATAYGFNPNRDSSLAAWWKLDDGSGSTAVDSSGKGNNGTLMSSPTWVTAGHLKGALQFNGTSQYVECGNGASLNISSQITLSAWIYPTNAGNGQHQVFVCKGDNSYALKHNTGNYMEFNIYDGTWYTARGPAVTAATFNNVWHHVAGTYDGTILKIYVEGVLQSTYGAENHVGVIASTTTTATLGRDNTNTGRYFAGMIDDARIYSRALTDIEVAQVMKGTEDGPAADPKPADAATDVTRDVILGWTPGTFPGTHNVYLGTSFNDVNGASTGSPLLVSKGQDANTYDPPGRLAFGTTYYWRVDEVNSSADHSVFKSSVWSFTTEPLYYKVTGITATASSSTATGVPANTINGSGLDANDLHSSDGTTMWLTAKGTTLPAWIQYDLGRLRKLETMLVWNYNSLFEDSVGIGAKDVTVEYSADAVSWTPLSGVPQFTWAPGADGYAADTTVNFGGVAARFVKLTITSHWSTNSKTTQTGLSEVRFLEMIDYARTPVPADKATGISPSVTLSWRSGREAASANVYVGTDPNALPLSGTSATNSFAPANLSLGTTYSWRVDEVNAAASPTTWMGDTWSFTTPASIAVDDMESYNDTTNKLYEVWIDGYNTGTNGAVVGYNDSGTTGTFGETVIVHGGKQSMPYAYGTGGIALSEATRTFDATQDWTIAGIKTLVLFFRGSAANTTGQLYLKINSTKVNYPGNPAGQASTVWTQWNIDLASVSGANLKAVKSVTIGVTGSGAKGTLYFDDILLYKTAPAAAVPTDPGTQGLVSYFDMENGKVADSVSGVTGTLNSITFTASMTGYGQAAVFSGTAGYVDLGEAYWTKVVSTLSSCTAAVWVNYAGGSAWQRVFDFGCGSNVNVFLTTGAGTAGMARFTVKTGVANSASTATGYAEATASASKALTTGWHHLVGVVDATGGAGGAPSMSLYIDGSLAGGPSAGRLPKDMVIQSGTPWQMWIGRSQYTADPYFSGSMDDLRIYNRALTAGEIGYLAGGR